MHAVALSTLPSCAWPSSARAGPGPSSARLQQQAARVAPLRVSAQRQFLSPPPLLRCASSRSAPLGGSGDLSGSPSGTPPPSPSAAYAAASTSSSSAYDRILAFVDASPQPAPVADVAAALAAAGRAGGHTSMAAAAAFASSPAAAALLGAARPDGASPLGAPPTYHFSYDEEAEEDGAEMSSDPQMAGVAAHAAALEPFSQRQRQHERAPAFAASAAAAAAAGDGAFAFELPPPVPAAAGTMSTARAVRRRARRAERTRRAAAAAAAAPLAASLGDLEAMAPWVSPGDAAAAAARAAERAARAAGAPHPARAAAAALAAIAGPAPRQALARRLEGVLERLTRAQAAGGLVYREPKRWVLTFDEESDAYEGAWDERTGVPAPPPGMRYAMATASYDEGGGMGDSY